MTRKEFEEVVEDAFERLPDQFKSAIQNVGIFVEELPSEELTLKLRLRDRRDLLGLYQGIPLTHRGTWYGAVPIPPDTVTLYQASIERVASDRRAIEEKIVEVLIHEIGHYFGMNEEEIRSAGY